MQTIESIEVIKQDLLNSGPCNLLITGPAECGKSTLVNEWMTALERKGVMVVRIRDAFSIASPIEELEFRLRDFSSNYCPIVYVVDDPAGKVNLNYLERLIFCGRSRNLYLVVVKQSPNVEFRKQEELKHIHLGAK